MDSDSQRADNRRTLDADCDRWPGLIRGLGCAALAAALAWHDREVSTYAIGVIALVASPGLAKAIIAPRLASILKEKI